jgi:ABC-type antimicrobial peptide transport system ATPase subunit
METESKSKFTELPMETQEILKNIDFPVKRNDIIGQARKSRAIPDILRELGMLPDRQYNSAEDVARELHIIYIGIPA